MNACDCTSVRTHNVTYINDTDKFLLVSVKFKDAVSMIFVGDGYERLFNGDGFISFIVNPMSEYRIDCHSVDIIEWTEEADDRGTLESYAHAGINVVQLNSSKENLKMKTQAYYDKKHLHQPELVGDEMTLLGMITWTFVLGSFLGWIFTEFLTGSVV